MSRSLKLGCAFFVLGCVALVAYYGLNRGVYIGSSKAQRLTIGPNFMWTRDCRYFSLSGGTFVRSVSDWHGAQGSHDGTDKTSCGFFAPKLVVIVQ
jgi:hypothetical protein